MTWIQDKGKLQIIGLVVVFVFWGMLGASSSWNNTFISASISLLVGLGVFYSILLNPKVHERQQITINEAKKNIKQFYKSQTSAILHEAKKENYEYAAELTSELHERFENIRGEIKDLKMENAVIRSAAAFAVAALLFFFDEVSGWHTIGTDGTVTYARHFGWLFLVAGLYYFGKSILFWLDTEGYVAKLTRKNTLKGAKKSKRKRS